MPTSDQSIHTANETSWQREIITHSCASRPERVLHGRPKVGSACDGTVAAVTVDTDSQIGIAVVKYIV